MAKIIGNTTATPNPRPDWNQTDETKADYIKNKPIILTESDVMEMIVENSGEGDMVIEGIQADWNQTDESKAGYIKNKPTLAAVATSGSYNDLIDGHQHLNKEALDKISEDENGNLLYDGNSISAGNDGKSAYEIAVANGFEGTEAEWLESLKASSSDGGVTQEEMEAYVAEQINGTLVELETLIDESGVLI